MSATNSASASSISVWQALGRALSPVEDRPRLAPDLETATYQTRSGAPYVVLHNPRTRSYARLDPREFELLPLMNGKRSVKELVIAYYQRHGVLALSRVASLVGLLRSQHFLAAPSTEAYVDLARRLRGQTHGPRSGALTTTSVDPVLRRAYDAWGHLFFHRAWLVIGIVLGILSPVLVLVELARGRYSLSDWGAVTVIVLIVLAVFALAIHELGHALAVKHAGRRVNEAGVRLYLGLPAAFVDTSDIWMAPPAQRLLTAFAGPWTGLVLGGLFAVAATALGGTTGTLVFTAAFVFLVDNLFNFNPLLELDGYYLLIDVLDRPLLRAQSLAFVRGPLWQRLVRRQRLTPDERLLAGFGLAAIAYSILAVFLAVRAWQALLVPLIVGNLTSADLPRQVLGLVILLAVAVPIALGILASGRQLMGPVRDHLAWLSGRAAEHRHREALAALRAVPLWSELPSGRLLEISRAMRAEDVRPGTAVVRQGDPGDRFYLIAHGSFEVRIDDRPRVRLARGDFFGERALLQRVPRNATVIATEAGQVFVLERDAFDALLATDLTTRNRLESAMAYRDEVAAMPLFHDLSPIEVDLLLARFQPVAAAPEEVIVRQGDRGDRFYVIRSGRLSVERDGEPLAQLGVGDAFGEIALLFDVPRTASVIAVQPTQLLALDTEAFRDVLASYLGRARELERLSHLRLLHHKRLDEVV